jgi:CubicO group peptidase (beta-lactamase class C family)
MSFIKPKIVFLTLLTLVGLGQAQVADSPKLPDTVAGRRVADYLKAFNSGDEKLMRDFFSKNVSPAGLAQRPVDARLGIYREMRGNLGTITLRRISEATESTISTLAQTRDGEWRAITFQFEPEPPHLLQGLRVEDADAPAETAPNSKVTSLAPARMTEPEILTATATLLGELVAADEFSGTVLIAKDGKPIFQKTYGLASKEYNVSNRSDTKFNLGSINKIFTQIAIGQLVEQGKLSFDDKLGRYLTDYPNRQAAEKVTIRQLLDMASGIGDFFGPEFEALPKNRLRTIRDFLPLFASEPLIFEPGTRHQYSNGGYIVLGAIIEKVSGQDYYRYVREHIFAPAGMQNTDWYEADSPTPNLATGYTREGAEDTKKTRRNNIYARPAKGSSAGGGYSTAEDLLKFTLALQTNTLRIPEFRKPAETENRNSTDAKPPGPGFVGIAGGSPGVNALLEMGPSGGYTLIVMSNYDPPSAEKVGKQIRGWLAGVKN